jgi:D-glycero-D-manno-heptose 1,7-bisphosphate phosphatase
MPPATAAPRPAIFLDRDGVIIENRADYVKAVAEVRFIPRALEALAAAARWAGPLIVVTNQSAVGRGLLTLQAAEGINAYVRQEVEAAGGRLDAVYMCPHAPEAGCACRKPQPGLLLRAAQAYALDLRGATLIGDALTDVQAAHAAGARAVLVRTGRGAQQAAELAAAGLSDVPVLEDLAAALEHVRAAMRP